MTDKERRRRKYANDLRYKKKLERQAKEIEYYPGPAYWVDERWVDGEYVPLEKPYARKNYKSSHAQRFSYYKKYSNRKVRRDKMTHFSKGNGVHKIFDYWYTVL